MFGTMVPSIDILMGSFDKTAKDGTTFNAKE
jgi:hypothetical protein